MRTCSYRPRATVGKGEVSEPWMTKADAAKFWGCSERSLEIAVKEGLPHAIVFGRPKFRPSECEPWMETHGHLERRNVDRGGIVVPLRSEAATADTAPPHDREVSPDGE